ncbi:hypothetical protein IE53DRAFT_130521, partial [Violaceomyces palustris]
MRFITAATVLLASITSSTFATPVLQELVTRDANGLIDNLRSNNLSRLADALAQNPEVTNTIFQENSKKYFLAPTDDAMQKLPDWVTQNKTILQATLLQHVLNGQFDSNKV